MSTLVYVGANQGNSLWNMIQDYDKVYAFEADPEIFKVLKKRFQQFEWVTLINAACSDSKGKSKFYITPNRVSSSLSTVSSTTHDNDHPQRKFLEIEVDTINLFEYLQKEGVDYIDFYQSDIQGSDLNVLKTLKPYIENKKIDKMFIETHGDNLYIYDNLYNQFQGFKDLLDDNYKFVYASLGSQNNKIVSEQEIPEGEYEWDSFWEVKK